MDRNEAKEFYPILQAFAEGSIIECRTDPSVIKDPDVLNDWVEMKEIEYWGNIEYRIKPELKYRPFKNAEECWAEMEKHQPFGWVNYNGYRVNIAAVMPAAVIFTNNKGHNFLFQQAFEECTFIDKQPFGIKVEEQLWHGWQQIGIILNGFFTKNLLDLMMDIGIVVPNLFIFQKAALKSSSEESYLGMIPL